MNTNDAYFMNLAIEEAKKGEGFTDPNPIVGCVIVDGHAVVATGYHEKYGEAHAEINALKDLGDHPVDNLKLYVTLEPCSTVGKTGKCSDAIIKSGIKTVIVGMIDPNPDHMGRGIEILKDAGIHVRLGVCESECMALNHDKE